MDSMRNLRLSSYDHVIDAALATPIDWKWYDRSDFYSYNRWWVEMLEEGLDTCLYCTTLMFSAH